ncbi:MAG TPA: hypothetical protein VFR27_13650 [Mycobacterium sp.]|nr:hypothetical protein [Mycobacterium sp.]
MAFASYQDEIYQRGMAGENPALPIVFVATTPITVAGKPITAFRHLTVCPA